MEVVKILNLGSRNVIRRCDGSLTASLRTEGLDEWTDVLITVLRAGTEKTKTKLTSVIQTSNY